MVLFQYANHRELYNVQRLCEISGGYKKNARHPYNQTFILSLIIQVKLWHILGCLSWHSHIYFDIYPNISSDITSGKSSDIYLGIYSHAGSSWSGKSPAMSVLTLIPTFALWHMLGSLVTKLPLICKIDGTHLNCIKLPHVIIRFGCRTCPIHWSRANPRSKEWLDTPDAPSWGYPGKHYINDLDVSSRDKSTYSI